MHAHACFPLVAVSLSMAVPLHGATQALGPRTVLPGDDGSAMASGLQQRPAWAAGDRQFLVVWEDARAVLGEFQERPPTTSSLSLFKTDLLAARFDASGQPLDEVPFVVSGLPWIQRYAEVAWNGENYLVVWQSEVSSELTYSDAIFAARVSPAGVVLDEPAILIDDSIDADEMEPAVASDGNGWAVTWHDFEPSTGLASVKGVVVSPQGSLGQEQVLGSSTSGFYAPRDARLAWTQDRYLVAWNHFGASGEQRNLYGRFFDHQLSPLGPEFEITGGVGNQVDPAVTSNGSQFFVAWGAYYRASPILLDGTVVVPDGVPFAAGTPAYGWTPSVAWDGSSYLVSWVGASQTGYSIHAARIDTGGELLSGYPATVQSGLPYAWDCVSIGGNGLGMLAWTDTRLGDWNDVWGTPIGADGTVGPDFPISIGAPTQTHVDLDGNSNDGYLISFVRRVSGSEAIQIQRVDRLGRPVDAAPTTLVSDVPNRLTHTAVAHSPDGWLVVWENIGLQRTQGMRVGLDGTVLDATPIDIVGGNTPDVAWLAGEFLVLASYRPVNHVRVPRIRRVRSSDGAPIGGEVSAGPGYALQPTVEGLDDRWLIAYEQHPTHDSPYSSITGVFVLPDGSVLSPMTLASGALATMKSPGIGAAGSGALVTWDDGADLRGRRMLSDGTLLDGGSGLLLCDAPNEQRQPAAAWNGSNWVVAFTDDRAQAHHDPGVGDAYLSWVLPSGAVPDRSGLRLAAHPFRAEGGTAVAASAGTALTGYVAFQDDAPFGTLRVEVRSVRTLGLDSFLRR